MAAFGLFVLGAAPAGPDLPPRPTPVIQSIPAPVQGAFIELDLGPAGAGMDVIVQWQTAAGDWVDISTWFGQVEADGTKRWWLAPEHFGTGPFRWQVRDASGHAMASSEPFSMPLDHGQVVVSAINIEN